jgi:hypothetical protein
MTAVILSHIFVLGYDPFFVDALIVMLLAVIYLLLTRPHRRFTMATAAISYSTRPPNAAR